MIDRFIESNKNYFKESTVIHSWIYLHTATVTIRSNQCRGKIICDTFWWTINFLYKLHLMKLKDSVNQMYWYVSQQIRYWAFCPFPANLLKIVGFQHPQILFLYQNCLLLCAFTALKYAVSLSLQDYMTILAITFKKKGFSFLHLSLIMMRRGGLRAKK